MIVYLSARSATSFGGNTTFSLVGDYLESGLGDYGAAVRELHLTACFRGERPAHSSLRRLIEEFHSTLLPLLPRVKFFRKKYRFEIEYETRVADANFLERYGFLSVEVFNAALNEVAKELHLIDSRLKKSDNFDLHRFHVDVSRLIDESPVSDIELKALGVRVEQLKKDRLSAMDPWEQLGIDWDEYHPAARDILNDPFFWSQTDEYAPHGNDTGADTLADFKEWTRRHSTEPAYKMAISHLRNWNITPIDFNAVDEEAVKNALSNDPDSLVVTNEVLIAVAFAAIKVRGFCDGETRNMAIAAIEREGMSIVMDDRGWKSPAERLRTLGLLSGAITRAPEIGA